MNKARPFPNGSAFNFWKSENCDKCSKYECESTSEAAAGCKMAFNLDLSSISDGEITKDVAEKIGFSEWRNQKAPVGTFVTLNRYCIERQIQ